MRLALMRPSAELAPLVGSYCLCDDSAGLYDGETICTAPQLAACICIQLGDAVVTDFRDRTPLMSFAGVQSRIRQYRPQGRVRAFLIFLTPLGSIRFLPSNGRYLHDEGHDIGGMIGDGEVLRLLSTASAARDDDAVARAADAWLRRLFERYPLRTDYERLAEAMRQMGNRNATVSSVARRFDLSERQLERSFLEHLGLSPKRYQQIHRVTNSLQATLTGRGDPLEGFSDQAHQIRNWRAHLGLTPGHVRRVGPSPLATMFQRQASGVVEEWAHYI